MRLFHGRCLLSQQWKLHCVHRHQQRLHHPGFQRGPGPHPGQIRHVRLGADRPGETLARVFYIADGAKELESTLSLGVYDEGTTQSDITVSLKQYK